MSQIPFFSALYVKAPPIPEQSLFRNNVSTWVVNFSEYLFSSPCNSCSFTASLNLRLSEVPSSTLKRIILLGLWSFFIIFAKDLWKVAAIFGCVKVLNRSGFMNVPSHSDKRRPAPSVKDTPPYHPTSQTDSRREHSLPINVPKQDQDFPIDELDSSFVVVPSNSDETMTGSDRQKVPPSPVSFQRKDTNPRVDELDSSFVVVPSNSNETITGSFSRSWILV